MGHVANVRICLDDDTDSDSDSGEYAHWHRCKIWTKRAVNPLHGLGRRWRWVETWRLLIKYKQQLDEVKIAAIKYKQAPCIKYKQRIFGDVDGRWKSSKNLIWEIKYKINMRGSHTHSRIQEDMGIVEDMSKKQTVEAKDGFQVVRMCQRNESESTNDCYARLVEAAPCIKYMQWIFGDVDGRWKNSLKT